MTEILISFDVAVFDIADTSIAACIANVRGSLLFTKHLIQRGGTLKRVSCKLLHT